MVSVEQSPTVPRLVMPSDRSEALIFLVPDGCGRNTIINYLELLGVGRRCKQHTTRPPRHPYDEEHYVHVVREEFCQRMPRHEYLLPYQSEGYWFGEPLTAVQQAWTAGKVALLKGPARCTATTKDRVFTVKPNARVQAILIDTQPPNAWIVALQNFGVPDLASRIAEGKRELSEAGLQYHSAVDHRIVDRAGEFFRTVEMVMKFIAAPRLYQQGGRQHQRRPFFPLYIFNKQSWFCILSCSSTH